MKVKFVSILMSLIITTALVPVCSTYAAETSGACGENLIWTLDDYGTLTISGTGEMENWRYGNEMPWNENKKSIKLINIEKGVTTIGAYAFSDCNAGNYLTTLDSVPYVSIPDSVTEIGKYAFGWCSHLTYVNIPNSVITIGDSAFNGCFNLRDINIPDSVTDIGNNAFSSCDSLTNVSIPSSVTSIGANPFESCKNLMSIEVDENNPSYLSIDGALFDKSAKTLIGSPTGRKYYSIPNGVTTIGDDAFYGETLTSVNIPDSVTEINNGAFSYCPSLTDIYYSGSAEQWQTINIGENNAALTSATIHYNSTMPEYDTILASGACGDNLSWNLDNGGVLTISGNGDMWNWDGVSSAAAGDPAPWYDNRFAIKWVNIKDGVTTIGDYAFQHLSELTSVSIPKSVKKFGKSAFFNCNILANVNIPNGVTQIGEDAFEICQYLKCISIPDSVTEIGNAAFFGCGALIDVYYNGSAEQWQAINMGIDNENLINATIHYGNEISDEIKNEETSFGSAVSEWAKEEVEEAYRNNLIPATMIGEDLTTYIDRAEFAAISVQLYEEVSGDAARTVSTPFVDIAENKNLTSIEKAYGLNITAGETDIMFKPDEIINREQIATMLTRTIKRIKFDDYTIKNDSQYYLGEQSVKRFDDHDLISDFAKESVYFLADCGIIKGTSTEPYLFSPNETVEAFATCEQAVVMALRIYNDWPSIINKVYSKNK